MSVGEKPWYSVDKRTWRFITSLTNRWNTFVVGVSKAFESLTHSFDFQMSMIQCLSFSLYFSFRFCTWTFYNMVVDGYHSSVVIVVFLMGPSFCQLIIGNLSCTSCHIHSSADDSTLPYSTRFNHQPTEQELIDHGIKHVWPLTCLSFLIGAGKTLLFTMLPKTQFLHLRARHSLPDNYPFIINHSQLNPSSSLPILVGLFPPKALNWKITSTFSLKQPPRIRHAV